jgi:hypothetical protein
MPLGHGVVRGAGTRPWPLIERAAFIMGLQREIDVSLASGAAAIRLPMTQERPDLCDGYHPTRMEHGP